jgi:hypothetical protein
LLIIFLAKGKRVPANVALCLIQKNLPCSKKIGGVMMSMVNKSSTKSSQGERMTFGFIDFNLESNKRIGPYKIKLLSTDKDQVCKSGINLNFPKILFVINP